MNGRFWLQGGKVVSRRDRFKLFFTGRVSESALMLGPCYLSRRVDRFVKCHPTCVGLDHFGVRMHQKRLVHIEFIRTCWIFLKSWLRSVSTFLWLLFCRVRFLQFYFQFWFRGYKFIFVTRIQIHLSWNLVIFLKICVPSFFSRDYLVDLVFGSFYLGSEELLLYLVFLL